MKKFAVLGAEVSVFLAGAAVAQEHWTEGPVWVISYYRTRQGEFDHYLRYLRANSVPQSMERKKQGLILDTKVWTKTLTSKDDWDVAIATLYPSYAKALDYSQADDDKGRAIAAQFYKTPDREKQTQAAASRFEMRDFVRTDVVREVTLRPLP